MIAILHFIDEFSCLILKHISLNSNCFSQNQLELEQQSSPVSLTGSSRWIILFHKQRRENLSSLLPVRYEEIRQKQMAWLWLRHSFKTPHHDFKWKLKSCDYQGENSRTRVCITEIILLCFSYQSVHASVYLDNKGLVLEARSEAQHAHVRSLINEVLNAMENSTTSGWDTPVDSSLTDGFSCHTCMCVDVL